MQLLLIETTLLSHFCFLFLILLHVFTCLFPQVTDKLSKDFAELRWVLLFRVKYEQKEPDINKQCSPFVR